MLVRAKESCFIDGSRRRPGAEFEYEPGEGKSLPRFLESVADVPVPKALVPEGEMIIAGKRARVPKTLHDHDATRMQEDDEKRLRASDRKVI